MLEETTKEWMKAGTIVSLEKKYGLKPSEYSLEMHKKYAAK